MNLDNFRKDKKTETKPMTLEEFVLEESRIRNFYNREAQRHIDKEIRELIEGFSQMHRKDLGKIAVDHATRIRIEHIGIDQDFFGA